jgi:hypothetical protein
VDERPGARGEAELPARDPILRGAHLPSLAARLDAWLADARVEGSADARARERWLEAAAAADATLAGVLLDLAERGTALTVATAAGTKHHGCVEVLGADFIALRTATGGEVLVALGCLSSVRTAPSVAPASGERPVTTELLLREVLGELAAERAPALLLTVGGDAVRGELRAVGEDVVTVRTAGPDPATVYVPVGGIVELALA